MPRLLGIRFESVGHRDARLDGLHLRLDRGGEPSDSVLWLRNGGGKSSLLNLLFSVVRPSQHDFLGSEAEARVRELTDYVSEGEVGAVCLEWLLDARLGEPRNRLFTCVCLEHRSGTANPLQRMFYALRLDQDSTLELTELPLFDQSGKRLLRGPALRERLLELHGRDGAQVVVTHIQREWEEHLDSFGIDPEVFNYQLKMNRREGAADELFRFNDSKAFVDFLLDMVVKPEVTEEVSRQLSELRQKVLRRPALVAEHAALLRVEGELRPLVELGQRTQRAREALDDAWAEAVSLRQAISASAIERTEQAARAAADEKASAERYAKAADRRNRGSWRIRALEQRLAAVQLEAAEQRADFADEEAKRVDRAARAAVQAKQLQQVRSLERRHAELKAQLEAKLVEHRPLLLRLQQAAASCVSALRVEDSTLEGRSALVERELSALAERLKQLQSEVDAAQRKAGSVEAQAESIQERLQRLDAARSALEVDGLILPNEALVIALGRLEAEREAAEERVVDAEEGAERARELSRAADAEAASEDRLAVAARAESDRLTRALEAAEKEQQELAGSAELQAALGDERPDLGRMGAVVLERLAERGSTLDRERVSLEVELRQAERAQVWLEQQSLLPPSVDAERVQIALKQAGVTAFSGTAYLAENAEPKIAEQRIRAHAALAAGVVVPEDEIAQASAALESAMPQVNAPVAVGSYRELLQPGEERLVIVPPRASFDRNAAIREREQQLELNLGRKQKLAELTRAFDANNALRERLSGFRRRHSPEWFENTRAEQSSRAHQRTAHEEATAGLRAESERHQTRTRELLAVASAAKGEEEAARKKLARLERFKAEGGGDLSVLRARAVELRAELAELSAAIEKGTAARAEAESTREKRQLTRHEIQAGRRSLAAELQEVAPQVGEATGETLPLDVARERFRTLKEQYEAKTAREALHGKLRSLEEQAVESRRTLAKALRDESLSEEEVSAALEQAIGSVGLEDWVSRAQRARGEAQTRLVEAKTALGLAKKQLEAEDRSLKELRAQGRGKTIDEALLQAAEWNEAALREALARESGEVELARGEEAEAAGQRDQARQLKDTAQVEVGRLEGWAKRVGDAIDVARNQPGERPPAKGEGKVLASLAGVEELVDDRLRSLRRATEEAATVREAAGLQLRKLNQFAGDLSQQVLPQVLRDRLLELNLDIALQRAPDHLSDVTQRAVVVQGELTEVDAHRQILSSALLKAAEDGRRVVQKLESSSTFPASVPVWGGEPFIKVKFAQPDAAERNAIGARLVDELVAGAELPSGGKLLKLMVRQLWKELEISILKPESQRRLMYEPVERLRAFSRGEQLTAAILLYCTLARLRARTRGAAQAPTSVLILDNPLGTCSNPALVELQRSMANVHGVQLVYTTGIEDLEALARLPNIVRLRNAHQDVRGRKRVTLEEANSVTPIVAARIAMKDGA